MGGWKGLSSPCTRKIKALVLLLTLLVSYSSIGAAVGVPDQEQGVRAAAGEEAAAAAAVDTAALRAGSEQLPQGICEEEKEEERERKLSMEQALPSQAQPNPPEWPEESVLIFSPNDDPATINARIEAATAHLQTNTGHFSDDRVLLAFLPGEYPPQVEVSVGYYVQALGLGTSPSDVTFTSEKGVYCPAADPGGAGSLDTFWRSVENLSVKGDMLWAVSQAAPMRNVRVGGSLRLHDQGMYASGGFMANVHVQKGTEFGSQQQFFSRNSHFGARPTGGAWSLVFAGCTGKLRPSNYPDNHMQGCAVSNIRQTPLHAEKPFIAVREGKGKGKGKEDGDGAAEVEFDLHIPPVREGSAGPDFSPILGGGGGGRVVGFESVYVAKAATDTAESIQASLDAGLHVVLSPGMYLLNHSLTLKHSNQVLLGLGMASIAAPPDGSPCVRVLPRLSGVRVAGLMLQASNVPVSTTVSTVSDGEGADQGGSNTKATISTLLEWGEEKGTEGIIQDDRGGGGGGDGGGDGADPGDARNPGVMSDIFARVGGAALDRGVNVDMMMRIHSGHVVGDNLWLWRADHSALAEGEEPREGEKYHLVTLGECRCDTGLEVTGDDVIMLGLFVEHTVKDLLLWSGERGKVLFYQSELPYDVDQESFGDQAYVGYRVHPHTQSHEAVAVGVYSFFRDHECLVKTAISSPPTTAADGKKRSSMKFVNPFTKHLNGKPGILSVINGMGPPVLSSTASNNGGMGRVNHAKCHDDENSLCVAS